MRKILSLWVAMGFVSGTWAQKPPPLHLRFSQAIAMAGARHVQVIVSNKRVLQAMSRLAQAQSTLLPQIDAALSQTRQTRNLRAMGIPASGDPLVGPFNTFDARVRITQTLFDASTVQRLRAAEKTRDLSLVEQRKAEQDAMALVAALYVDAYRAEQGRDLARMLVERDVAQARLAHLRVLNGTASLLDVQQADAALADSQAFLKQAESDSHNQKLDLGAALGMPADQLLDLISAPETIPWGPFSAAELARLIQNNPDVNVARRNLDVAQAQHEVSRRDYLPKATASADYGASGETPDGALATYTYGGQISVPIFSGGLQKARVQEARHISAEMEATLQDAFFRADSQARTANETLKRTWVQLQARRADRDVAVKQRHLAEGRLSTGLGSGLEVIQARAQEASAEDQYREAVALYQTAQINLAHAVGQMEKLAESRVQG